MARARCWWNILPGLVKARPFERAMSTQVRNIVRKSNLRHRRVLSQQVDEETQCDNTCSLAGVDEFRRQKVCINRIGGNLMQAEPIQYVSAYALPAQISDLDPITRDDRVLGACRRGRCPRKVLVRAWTPARHVRCT